MFLFAAFWFFFGFGRSCGWVLVRLFCFVLECASKYYSCRSKGRRTRLGKKKFLLLLLSSSSSSLYCPAQVAFAAAGVTVSTIFLLSLSGLCCLLASSREEKDPFPSFFPP